MHCIDNKEIKYKRFIHKIGGKKKNDKFGYFEPITEKWISPEEIEFEKETFLKHYEGVDVKRHNKYCVEYEDNGSVFLDYIMGFVAVEQR